MKRGEEGLAGCEPARVTLNDELPSWTGCELQRMGCKIDTARNTSGPIPAILFDHEHGTLWGAASHHGEDYGIAW